MMWVQAWVVAGVVSLAGHAHGQLGVGGEEKTQELNASTSTDQLLPDKHEKGKESEWGDAVSEGEYEYEGSMVRDDEWRWRPLCDTYQGCFLEEKFNGTLMFVNLTQVMEIGLLESVEHACFHMCRIKKPHSIYFAISPAVSSGADGCGCKDLLDYSNKVDDDRCDEVVNHYRVYCGPANWACLNQGGMATSSSLLLCLPLAALLRSLVSNYEDV